MYPDATVFPSFIQVIFGIGFPVALQWNVALSPSVTVLSTGFVTKLGPTETKTKWDLSYLKSLQ